MSKSLKNFITIDEFLQQYSADEFRMYCLMSRYRSGIDFSSDNMNLAKTSYQKLKNFLTDAEVFIKDGKINCVIDEHYMFQLLEETKEQVRIALADDFNTSHCISSIQKLISETNKITSQDVRKEEFTSSSSVVVAVIWQYISELFEIFGLSFNKSEMQTSQEYYKLENVIDQSVKFRGDIRHLALNLPADNKNTKKELLEKCDILRKTFSSYGIQIKDHKHESRWSFSSQQEGEKRKESL